MGQDWVPESRGAIVWKLIGAVKEQSAGLAKLGQ